MPFNPVTKKLPAPSSSSTALQKHPSANGGTLRALPLRVCECVKEEEEKKEIALSLSSATKVTFLVAGQTIQTSMAEGAGISAPLSHLYHAQLRVQLENMSPQTQNKGVTYRGSYPVCKLPIHEEACIIRIPIKLQQPRDAITSTKTNASTTNAEDEAPSLPDTLFLHLQCSLEGPCRPEILKLQQYLNTWLNMVALAEDVIRDAWNKVSPHIPNAAKKKEALLILIPAFLSVLVPVAIGCVIVSPVVVGFCVLFFPIMIPLVVGICLVVLASLLGTGLVTSLLYASTRYGRKQLTRWWKQQSTLQYYWKELKGPRFGLQTFVYATGPRPTPVTLVRTQMPTEKWRRLGVSLTIDGVGSFSYLLPFVGEAFDVVWAPAQTVLIMALYQHVSPNMSYVSFAEEMLPFLDVLPSATTGWAMEFGPALLEDAKYVAQNPSSVRRFLWGTSSSSQNAPGGRIHRRGPPPAPTRPMRAV